MTEAIAQEARARAAVPLTDADIKKYLPGCPIIKYSELSKYSTLFDLLPDIHSYCIILYEDSVNTGHWTQVCRPEDGVAAYFDSYGGPPDAPLKWTARDRRVGLGVAQPFLSILLGDALREKLVEDVQYNKRCYQKDGGGQLQINDCGRWCVLWTLKMLEGLDLEGFSKFVSKTCRTMRLGPDEMVSTLIV
jgi:hypothetical protein